MASQNKTVPIGTPAPELEIDADLVHQLLVNQHPDLAHLPIQLVDSGWDNVMFRLGERWAVRLPRRAIAVPLLENEQIWLPQLASRLPLAVPVPDRVGTPNSAYPWRWSIIPWLAGVTADQQEPDANQVNSLVAFLRALHHPAPETAPRNPFRGVPLHQRVDRVAESMQRLATKTDLITPALKHLWEQALNAPIDVPATWLHGDLHARNVLVQNGTITGIIDWGDMTSGDRATDLAAIWMLFGDRTSRQQAIASYAMSEATVQRARGWAILFGVLLLDTGRIDHPQHAVMGERTLRRITEDEPSDS